MANSRKTRRSNFKKAAKEFQDSTDKPKTRLGRHIKVAKMATQKNKDTTKARKAAKKKK